MTTVKELKELLNTMGDDLELVIYPKYSSHKVDGYKKHSFRIDQVCKQEPYAINIKNDKQALKDYLGNDPKSYEINEHVAIIF